MNEKDALQCLKDFKNILDKNNICFWCTWGTLLGIIRDKQFIKDDNDIDIITVGSNREKIRNMNDFVENGFSATYLGNGFEFVKNNIHIGLGFYEFNEKCNTLENSGFYEFHDKFVSKIIYYFIILPTIDLKSIGYFKRLLFNIAFFVFKKTGGIYVKIIFPAEYVFPLQKKSFYDDEFSIPNKPEKYLEYLYVDWHTRIKDEDFHHCITKEDGSLNQYKGAYGKVLVKCPKCKKEFIINNQHKRDDKKGKIIRERITCECGFEWYEDIYVLGIILKKFEFGEKNND